MFSHDVALFWLVENGGVSSPAEYLTDQLYPLTIDLQAFRKRHICISIVWDLVCRQHNFVCDTSSTAWSFLP